jgi:hypothetical protein
MSCGLYAVSSPPLTVVRAHELIVSAAPPMPSSLQINGMLREERMET